MIGEDFRSRARGNLLHSVELEQRIEGLQERIKEMQKNCDTKDNEIVIKDRESESF